MIHWMKEKKSHEDQLVVGLKIETQGAILSYGDKNLW